MYSYWLSHACSKKFLENSKISYPTRSLEDVGVVRIVVPLTGDLDPPKSVLSIHVCLALPLDIIAIRPPIQTLHHTGLEGMAACSPPNTGELRNWRATTTIGHLSMVEGDGRNIRETNSLVVLVPIIAKPCTRTHTEVNLGLI